MSQPRKETSVYVQNLPVNTSTPEVVSFFSKVGVIRKDEETNSFRVKLYQHPDGSLKGDAKVTFLRPESVDLAVSLLDDTHFRFGDTSTIRVEPVTREVASSSSDTPKPQFVSTISSRERKRRFKQQYQKALGWDLQHTEKSAERTVVLRNMFTLEEMSEEMGLASELKQDVASECSKYGDVLKVKVYGDNPEGVITVTFSHNQDALNCVHVFNGRRFAGKIITAEIWDSKERFKRKRTEDDDTEELQRFESLFDTKDS
ncbi:hypothetical protein RCL1_005710 [Eukaryota sp. TZLM3-RCL]